MNRDDGFYWVLLNDKWQVAEFKNGKSFGSYWKTIGSDEAWDDSDFTEIDERRVYRDPPIFEQKCCFFVGVLNEPHAKCRECGREEWQHK